MDEDLIETLRERLTLSQASKSFSRSEAAVEANYSDSVVEDYSSGDPVKAGVAAFRLRSFLEANRNAPVRQVGPQRPLLREMAQEAIATFNRK